MAELVLSISYLQWHFRTPDNPPFIGTARMRDALGDGYTDAIHHAYPKVPDSADFVMYWWEKASLATRAGRTRRFGFITSNFLRHTCQTPSRPCR